ncbi:HesA/MoeB/ThiF family protein [Photorhabdus heterorhabditis]|uniref:ThiF family adenylyltransferase n=1 Tax=Photorhabdus heterorhabditis TaxID=880156 RepID=A0A5B0X1V3_9GAMM|nr:ThiF family adenylyltransferase [Photorhabdus heterorhabditis]KAA1192291.1 ThiF family adenylyltransferase [Photorhabdus heterorhabditis]MBS9441797.1 ThiF family adenylyltransferase [Photorhabdus heterorhabditis]
MRITKPLIKRSHHIILSDDGDICIGEVPKKSQIIKNPPEWVKVVLSKLDGFHTIPRIIKEISHMGYKINEHEIVNFIEKLNSFGLIEDNAIFSDILTSQEIELYDRQLLQYSLIDNENINSIKYQERLKESRILVLGMGGWGTWCSLQLALAGVGTLRIVDGDDVELSNLNRQVLYTFDDIGKNKVDAAEEGIKRHNKYTNVEKYFEFATTDENRLKEMLDGVDLVLLAWASLGYFRKNTVEGIVHELACNKNIPVIELGGDPFEISVGPIYLNNGQEKTYFDAKKSIKKQFYSENNDVKKFQEARMKQQFLDGNRKVNAWQSAPSLAAMSGLVADQVVKIITGYDEPALVGKKLYISLRDFKTREEYIFDEN